ncbi:MAG: phenylalanine--tRNA ligase subunit beta [Pseudomonadota bacterium]
MKFSEKWLREWTDPDLSTEELSHQLTMAGLEVEGIEPVAGAFSGVVVAQIVAAEPHPDADKLQVCQVDAGGDTLQVVCGAPNARAGLKAPLATVGGALPGDVKIKRATLRGVESRGMLCAEQELGLSDAKDGLMELPDDAPVGKDLRDYLQLDDQMIELGLTPNRADCLSIRGIAREVGLLSSAAVTAVEVGSVAASCEDTLAVELRAVERCPRFAGRVIRGVDLRQPSPLWMQEKLRRCGVRSIDAVVDVTNYVMLELGQPMHAYDLAALQGGIIVRTADQGEALALLDGSTVELDQESLVIADHRGAVGLAGIMGGEHTAVRASTVDLFLEAAFFTPERIAGKARRFGMHTDASHRFERGVDFARPVEAIERATQLLLETVGGEAGHVIDVVSEADLPTRSDVPLRAARIEKMLGLTIDGAEVERILCGLGLDVRATADGWICSVPSWRFDIGIEADLLEELARVYGYNRLPASRIHADLVMPAKAERKLSRRLVRHQLAGRGYREAITYSFVDPALQAIFDPDLDPIRLTNPISAEMAVMRTSLLPGLVAAVRHNVNRQQSRVRLFEMGLRFQPDGDDLQQVPTLAMIVAGGRGRETWTGDGASVDFYDLKGDLESVLRLGDANRFEFDAAQRSGLHPGQTAAITRKGQRIGYLGALHPSVGAQLDIALPVLVCEIDLVQLLEIDLPRFAELSKFPGIRRDLSFVVDREVAVHEVLGALRSVAGSYLADLTLFDVYTGKGIDPKRKSLSVGLTFRDQSRTLGDEDVNPAVGQVIDLLKKNYKAELRN